MIRTIRSEDMPQLQQMIQNHVTISGDELSAHLQAPYVYLFDDGSIKGCATLSHTKTPERTTYQARLFVDPAHRGNGIGTLLWNRIAAHITPEGPTRVIAQYRVEGDQTADLFLQQGFRHVVDTCLMGYDGPAYPEPDLHVHPFEEKHFAAYISILNEAFRPLREEVSLPPHLFPETAYSDDALRANLIQRRADIYMLSEGAETIGVVELEGPYIENIALRNAYQGRGYGPKMTRFAVNRLLERGVTQPSLYVGAPNHRARRMYTQLGFSDLQTMRISFLEMGE